MNLREYLGQKDPQPLPPGSVQLEATEFDSVIDPMNDYPRSGFVTIPALNTIFGSTTYYRRTDGVLLTVKNGVPHHASVFSISDKCFS